MRTITIINLHGKKITIQHGSGICAKCGLEHGNKWYCINGLKYHKECVK